MKLETTIPFQGFYCSVHDSQIDNALEQLFSDYETGCDINQELFDKFHMAANYAPLFEAYSKAYANTFASELNLTTLKFETLSSPKYYNYETDRIVCTIELSEVRKLWRKIDKAKLDAHIKERFTSYDGFMSFYPNSLDEWPKDLRQWDLNHIGTLLEVYADTEIADFNQWECYAIDAVNEIIDRVDFGKEATRIIDLHYYLEKRKERKRA